MTLKTYRNSEPDSEICLIVEVMSKFAKHKILFFGIIFSFHRSFVSGTSHGDSRQVESM